MVILLHFSLTAHIKISGSGIDVKAHYLWFTLYPRKPKKPKKRRSEPPQSFEYESLDDDLNVDDDNAFEDIVPQADDESEPAAEEETAPDVSISSAAEDTDIETAAEHDKFGMDKLEESFEEEDEEELPPSKKDKIKDKIKTSAKTKKKREKRSKAEKKPKNKPEGKLQKLKDKYNKIKPYVPTGWKACKKMLKTIRFEDLRAVVNVGRFDAHEAVIYYGALQGAMFNLLGTVSGIFTVKVKKAQVNCVFTQNTISGEFETDIRIRPSAVIALGVCTGVNFLIVFLKQRRKNKRAEKISAENDDKNGQQTPDKTVQTA